MTREQAINYLFSSGFTNEQVGEVVRALTYEPTTKNDLGVDCISRDSAIKALGYDIKSFKFKSGISEYMDDIANLLDTTYEIQENNIKALPSVTPQEPRKGHWIANAPQYDMFNPQYICSECGNAHTRITPYCEMCGAKMVEPQERSGEE